LDPAVVAWVGLAADELQALELTLPAPAI